MIPHDFAPPWRLIHTEPASGASNMALDQALLEAASGDKLPVTLRFYRWDPPALSIGRFQPLSDVDLDACASEGIEVVRRPTGGKSILHLDDFTYSIVIPRGLPLPENVITAYRLISGGILRALRHLGLTAVLQSRASEDYRAAGGACFAAATQADLEYNGKKLCGSAQVRRGGATLQHGSIMIEDHSDMLFGLLRFDGTAEMELQREHYRLRCTALSQVDMPCTWADLAGSFVSGFREAFDVDISPGSLSTWEKERWHILTDAYASSPWLDNADSHAFPQA
ncbi:MAG: lipoate--protein ligase family protein [Actinobacteria bacterium]|nr:lipoate--protein ligase family protein [Actinomycetota bacterium]